MQIIFHTLFLIKEETNVVQQTAMMNGFTLLLQKYHHAIKEWIKMNLVL